MKPLAAIDIGSNTVHILVVQPRKSRGWKRLGAASEFIGLGGVVARHGHFPAGIVRKLHRILKHHIRYARQKGAQNILIAATAAVRRSANGPEAMRKIARRIGIPIYILSAEREGALGFLGVQPVLHSRVAQLTIDAGGGSTELTLSKGRRRVSGLALPVGTGMLLARVAHDPPDPFEWARLREPVQQALAAVPRNWTPRRAVAFGGSARQFPKLLHHRSRSTITVSELGEAVRLLLSRSAKKLAKKTDIKAQRIRTLPVGALILATILEQFNLNSFVTTRRGLRDGIIQAYLSFGENWWKE